MPEKNALPPPVLRSITPRNLLSFGPMTEPIELQKLNVLIGPNGSGKSNLIEALVLARATEKKDAGGVREVLEGGGGEWIWKGDPGNAASCDLVLENPDGTQALRHYFSFKAENQAIRLCDERIENERPYDDQPDAYFYYRFNAGSPYINSKAGRRQLERIHINLNAPILAQIRDPEVYPELAYLSNIYNRIVTYREWAFGRNSVFRKPQRADLRTDRLEEDFSNLAMFLNRLARSSGIEERIVTNLRNLYDGVNGFGFSIEGGTAQIFFKEGRHSIPASRLSDGSLRYLCLLAILCDPEPPPLICIEEPELGLHPDVLPNLTRLMIEASERTQLIVTTHSDIIVDVLTDYPEAVLVCEKREGSTVMRRLDSEDMSKWLDKYRLGELWMSGQIGGNRW